MQDNYISMLEFDKIKNILSSYAVTFLGKESCANLLPSFQLEVVQSRLLETDYAFRMLHHFGSLPLESIPNIRIHVKHLESGLTLSPKALLEIAAILRTSQNLHAYFSSEDISKEDASFFATWTNYLYRNSNLENEIFSKILDENTIEDNASSTLSSIRRNLRSTEQSIKDTLHSLIHSSSISKYLQEPVITIRNNRYVVPVKEEYRSQVKGLVHDVSASGSTVFMEPLSVFELNNKMSHLYAEESSEIQKILDELSKHLSPITDKLFDTLNHIGELDFIFAKANYAKAIQATLPILTQKKQIEFLQARHPLISPEKVVPISLSIGKEFQTLVITGPNTGGKTVTLKTIGLLCLMAYSGLFIPVNEHSSLSVFSHIFVDIGDEQSIQESLSTFSSHMVNIVGILDKMDDNSLVLLDELGSGTDPIEGSSLAISILETLFQSGCITIATTHYPEIKQYALVTHGFENASCEFDVEHLKPTYRLLLGIPGRSNAFAISKRLGLNPKILDRANSLLKQDEVHMEELLKSIYEDKIKIEKQKEEIQKSENQITLLRKKLEQDVFAITVKKNELIESAKQEARKILFDAKETANRSIKKMNEISSSHSALRDLNQIRNELNEAMKTTANPILKENPSISTKIQKGDIVLVRSLNQTGTVLSDPNKSNQVPVQVGSTKLTLPISYLTLTQNTSIKNNSTTSATSIKSSLKSKTATTEINVIGCNVEEAIFLVDKFLDDSSLAKLSSVRIVHGKGTGALKNGIHSFLKKHPHVKSFRLGTFGEGEMGVTVVELK